MCLFTDEIHPSRPSVAFNVDSMYHKDDAPRNWRRIQRNPTKETDDGRYHKKD